MSWHRGEEHGGVARVLQEEGCPGWDHCLGPLGHSPHKVGPGSEIIPLGIHSLLKRKQPRSDRPTSATPPVSLPSCPSPLGGHRGGGVPGRGLELPQGQCVMCRASHLAGGRPEA